ncbi:hypothetical protein P8C59_006379 [Phyllachora maydis]|uniref:Queuosine 5'-phosphate N-glycosylase/hydrolase n=1 Tax=Phyllachora maydis TaxID=1825666 RepID=A0AAD9I6S1_9PEZI|nr:hypothetical protein P8C59_006379 [Phyllachora maydis]
MSDDEADLDLLALLRQHLAGKPMLNDELETGVLEGAEYVYDNAIDVALDMRSTKNAAATIYAQMQNKNYTTAKWSEPELHPKTKDEATLAFIFTMDLLNFCFWSERPEEERFAIFYRGKKWTGYWSLVAALQRAQDEGIPITDPHFWQCEDECTLDVLRQVFRSCTDDEMPLLSERLSCLREAGQVLYEKYQCSITTLVSRADNSAAALVNILARDFACFRDEHPFEGRRDPIRILKRAQIFVADTWACFDGESFGHFRDIDKITMFADYRLPQILNTMGCISYSPSLNAAITSKRVLRSGESWEVQLRACSIWSWRPQVKKAFRITGREAYAKCHAPYLTYV